VEELLLKPAEVAETLRVGRSLVYEMFSTGELPSIRVGRCIRVPRVALDRWIADHVTGFGGGVDRGGISRPVVQTEVTR
jgi:excisionase family DNA binding protein